VTKAELLRYSGNIAQIASISEKSFVRGKARGMSTYEVRTGSGLEFSLLPDKCLDIHELRYKGRNIAFQAKTGLVGPAYGYPLENEFDVYWTAGMLYTCGLLNIGTDCHDENGRYQPIHGRIGMTPSEQSSARAFWEGEAYKLEARALTRESVLGQQNLCLSRKISSELGSSSIRIEDTITNDEATSARYMLLYHFNFGYPFICEDTRLLFPAEDAAVEPRTESARPGLATWDRMERPIDERPEEVFFHHPVADANGLVTVKLENHGLGIGCALSYTAKTLPVLSQWKSLRSGEYVLGVEPGTTTLRGRAIEGKDGRLRELKAFASESHSLSLSLYDI